MIRELRPFARKGFWKPYISRVTRRVHTAKYNPTRAESPVIPNESRRLLSSTLSNRRIADLTSDTKTLPCAGMYAAMQAAVLGDDVAHSCPTTRELEVFCAELLGMESAILVSSGTQGNLLCIAAQCPRGTELVAGSESHVHLWEAGGLSVLFGLPQRTVPLNAAGCMPLAELEAALDLSDPSDDHCNPTRLVSLENTCGARAGVALDIDYIEAVSKLCRRRGLRLHVDGARLFNAAALAPAELELADAVKRVLPGVDTVTFCLSKGLGCPGGAIIAGDAATIAECRRLRKMVGSSTRQAAGLLAAAGLHAMRDRNLLADLRRDHSLMRRLVESVREIPGVSVQYGGTNMAVVELDQSKCNQDSSAFTSLEKEAGVRIGKYKGSNSLRLVTHRGVSETDVDVVVAAFARAAM